MPHTLDPTAMRALAERLVRIPSVSPDPDGETACVAALEAALPERVRRGTWLAADGRPVLWAHLPGRSRRSVVLLGHVDTVGVDEFATLGGASDIAFDPAALRAALVARLDAGRLPAPLAADVAAERDTPGTWMFGRGALDMKAGLAAALGTLHALAARRDPPDAGALLVVTPDEEHASAGMLAAVPALARLRDALGLELAGAVNLDYTPVPGLWRGVRGKALAAFWVLGRPTHAGLPLAGVDAAQVAAEIATRAARSRTLVDRDADGHGVPAVTLRLRDLKPRYDVQTAAEAVVELNLITCGRTLADTLERLRSVAIEALAGTREAMASLAAWLSPGAGVAGAGEDPRPRVLPWPELAALAGAGGRDDPAPGAAGDARAWTLERTRALARRAGLAGPAVVVCLLPPFYPHAALRDGPLARAAGALAERERIELLPHYPLISDACYLAWREGAGDGLEAHLPALGAGYAPPIEAARALDLDVVSLGPWGHDAHGLGERCHAPYAFERLPRLVAELIAGIDAG